jgi:uncharacterized sulfatase
MFRVPIAGLLGMLTMAVPALAQEKPAKLNVVFIVCDDLNNNLGCYGHPVVQSPCIDRLAEQGVRFDRAYCQNPFCNPSRTSFLSRRRPGSSLNEAVWMPNYFHSHGYFTAAVGKVAHGFGPSASYTQWDLKEPNPQPRTAVGGEDARFQGGKVARRAVELFEQNRDRPFFLGIGLAETHPGYTVPKKYYDMYPPEKIVLVPEPPEHLKAIPPVAIPRTHFNNSYTDEQKRKLIANYYAHITYVDAQVGVILDALDRLKLSDRTVVLFTSDHGKQLGEHGGLWGKRALYEECNRVPLVVRAPGKRSRAVSPRLVEMVDFFPTLADLCGLPPPKEVEGTSFVPLLETPDRPWKTAAFTYTERADQGVPAGGWALRTERYRYVEWGGPVVAQLFDLQTDPREYVNLVDDPKHAAVLAELRQQMKAGWRAALPPP